jgi:hypothetical protein
MTPSPAPRTPLASHSQGGGGDGDGPGAVHDAGATDDGAVGKHHDEEEAGSAAASVHGDDGHGDARAADGSDAALLSFASDGGTHGDRLPGTAPASPAPPSSSSASSSSSLSSSSSDEDDDTEAPTRGPSRFTTRTLAHLAAAAPACPLRVVAHVDVDAFYAQCEMRRLGVARDVPLAVRQW